MPGVHLFSACCSVQQTCHSGGFCIASVMQMIKAVNQSALKGFFAEALAKKPYKPSDHLKPIAISIVILSRLFFLTKPQLC